MSYGSLLIFLSYYVFLWIFLCERAIKEQDYSQLSLSVIVAILATDFKIFQ